MLDRRCMQCKEDVRLDWDAYIIHVGHDFIVVTVIGCCPNCGENIESIRERINVR